MKKIHLLLLAPLLMVACLIVACQIKPTAEAATIQADTTLKLPYSLKKQRTWEMNPDPRTLEAALNAVKAFENNDTTALKGLIADSVHVYYEGGEFNGKRSEFLKAIKEEMDLRKNVQIEMEEWQSIIDKNKNEEWVSMWYKQKWEDANGDPDSLQVYNDVQLKYGKIIKWVDYSRHYTSIK